MVLYKYFKPCTEPLTPEFEKEVEKEVAKVERESLKGRKRGHYATFSPKEKAEIAKYAVENGVHRALEKYKDKNLKETTLRDWKKVYEKELKDKCKDVKPGEPVIIKLLPTKKRGRPPLLGSKLDKHLQAIIVAMREKGTAIGTTVLVGIAKGLILKHRMCFSGSEEIRLNREWARSVLRRMGYSKRRACSTNKLSPTNFLELKKQYLVDIKSVVEMEDIPNSLILNWDQTAMKIVPSSSWTMEKRGCKRVKIAAVDDKRQITAVFACSVLGYFLPVQLIYHGTTERCLPPVTFPPGWHITCTVNHWSTEATMIDYIKKNYYTLCFIKEEGVKS